MYTFFNFRSLGSRPHENYFNKCLEMVFKKNFGLQHGDHQLRTWLLIVDRKTQESIHLVEGEVMNMLR